MPNGCSASPVQDDVPRAVSSRLCYQCHTQVPLFSLLVSAVLTCHRPEGTSVSSVSKRRGKGEDATLTYSPVAKMASWMHT